MLLAELMEEVAISLQKLDKFVPEPVDDWHIRSLEGVDGYFFTLGDTFEVTTAFENADLLLKSRDLGIEV